jgi:hypothetical protein
MIVLYAAQRVMIRRQRLRHSRLETYGAVFMEAVYRAGGALASAARLNGGLSLVPWEFCCAVIDVEGGLPLARQPVR